MRILLPPSESKRPDGGSGVFTADRLAFAADLDPARARVRAALETLSRDAEAAAKALKLGVKNRGELAHNLALGSSPVLPGGERYIGVLYDALGFDTLEAPARAWAERHVLVQSALFGLIGAADPIPAYRLSGSSRLPGLGASLKAVWREAHAGIDWAGFGFVLDLRSQEYAELAPLPEGAGVRLHVAQRGPDGAVRALNHFNKAAKGDLVRRLARSLATADAGAPGPSEPGVAGAAVAPDIDGVDDLVAWAAAQGLELGEGPSGLTLITELGAPAPAAVGARSSAR